MSVKTSDDKLYQTFKINVLILTPNFLPEDWPKWKFWPPDWSSGQNYGAE